LIGKRHLEKGGVKVSNSENDFGYLVIYKYPKWHVYW